MYKVVQRCIKNSKDALTHAKMHGYFLRCLNKDAWILPKMVKLMQRCMNTSKDD